MKHVDVGLLCVALILGAWTLETAGQGTPPGRAVPERASANVPESASTTSAFAKSNMHAWAFEEYDAVARTPSERAAMLRTLGIMRAGYIGRHVARMSEFDAYMAAYREQRIELVAAWTPIHTATPLEEEHIRMFLDGVARHRVTPQWWVTLEEFDGKGDRAVERAVAILRPVIAAAAKRGLRLALYGHGRDAWFTQPESQIAIIERLQTSGGAPAVGIAYNFHHAHSQLARFAAVLPKMRPHLIAVNLNGMRAEGPQILSLGDGDREQEMIASLQRSGYRGPVGIIAHQRTLDAAAALGKNLAGLRRILTAIGDTAGASTY